MVNDKLIFYIILDTIDGTCIFVDQQMLFAMLREVCSGEFTAR